MKVNVTLDQQAIYTPPRVRQNKGAMGQRRNVVLIIVITVIILEMWGQYSISPINLTDNFWTSLYQVVMLFYLSGDWTLELTDVPLQIEVVRLIAPLALLASIFVVLASSIEVYITNYLVHLYSGHTVVVGLADQSERYPKFFDDEAADKELKLRSAYPNRYFLPPDAEVDA